MIRGDLATMSLPDLLQWVDATRKSAVIEIERGDGIRAWMALVDRHVIASSLPISRGILAADGSPAKPGPGLRAAAIEGLLDLFFDPEGTFVLREGSGGHAPGVPVEVQIGFLVMEGLRQLDEWPRIEEAYPDEGARLKATAAAASAAELSVVQRALLDAAKQVSPLGEIRLVPGLSRHAVLRRIDELRAIGLVEVEGAEPSARDLPKTLSEQASLLLRERQFAEAAHVLRSLLATTPGDARLQRLLAQAEREHVAACYEVLAPTDLVKLGPQAAVLANQGGPSSKSGLSAADHALIDALTQKPRSVAALVLVSPLRELETLLALVRLMKKSIVEVVQTG